MSAPVTVGLLHPGRMGATIAAQITIRGHTVLWCPDGRSTATFHRAEDAGLRPAPLGELLANSEVVLSICPPVAAEEIATTVAGHGYRGTYVEANAISPARMHRITTRFTGAGTTVIDGCIFVLSAVDLADDAVIGVADDLGVERPRRLGADGALVVLVTGCSAW